jgi:3-oxoadipate enol-lactonase
MYAKINGFGIDYSIEGSHANLPVVLIHGFPFSKEMWKPQIEVLKQDYYIISYDVRGHGRSDVGNGQYTIEYCVDDLIGLLDLLKISQAVLVGLSMGGYIALRTSERNPERLKGLVLCDTRSEADTNEVKIKRALQAKSVKIYGSQKFANTFIPTVLYENTIKKKPEIVMLLRNIIETTSPITVAGMLIALAARTDTTPWLHNIKLPTLLMVGQYDELTPSSVLTSMENKIPNAEMHIIPEAAHLCNLENPDEFNKHLLAFLEKI